MSGILVVAETRRGELRDISLELVSAGRAVKEQGGGDLKVVVVESDPDRFVERLSVDGVDEVIAVRAPTEHFEPHVAERALDTLLEEERPGLVLLGHTIDGLGLGPAVAARRGLGFASDAASIAWENDAAVVRRGAYGDKLDAELEFPGKETVLVMLRPGAYEPASGRSSPALRSMEIDGEVPTEHVEFREAAVGDVDITRSDFLLSIGRGIEDKDNIPQFEELAGRMGATLSVSRPLVDAGWISSARQVGQSGKTVKPTVYVALGISGAVQHLAGMQTADTIIAVNSDPEAPIFNVAHFGAVADLFDVADELAQHFE